MKPTLTEWIKHKTIGTAFAPLAEQLLSAQRYVQISRHPEISNIYMEEVWATKVFERLIKPDTNCIDIGCHIGSVIQQIVELAPQGKHIAVEPVSYKAEWLAEKYPQVRVEQCALSDTPGIAEFYYSRSHSAYSGLSRNERIDDFESYEVECKRLEEITDPDTHYGLVKIDVEGAELMVLAASKGFLQVHKPPVLFECTPRGVDATHTNPEDLHHLLQEELGYEIYRLNDWLEGAEPLNTQAFAQSIRYPFTAFNFLAIQPE